MFARFSLVTGLLACMALFEPLPAEAGDTRVIIGVPNIGIYAPPLSIQIGPQPMYYPYYYYPPSHHHHYYPAPGYYYGPRYYPAYRNHPHQRYHRGYYYRDHYRRRW